VLLLAAYVAAEFGNYLGFNLHRYVTYPIFFVIPITAVGLAQLLASHKMLARLLSSALEKRGLVAVVGVAAIVRIAFGMWSSVFPDEYLVMGALRSEPLENLGSFLFNYQSYVGPLSIHPPLSFILMSIGYAALPSLIGARLVSVLFSTATVVIVYCLVCDVGHPRLALLASAIYALVPHTSLFLSLALTDAISTFFGVTSFWLLLRAMKQPSIKLSLLSGVFLSLALWSKAWLPLFWLCVSFLLVMTNLYSVKAGIRSRLTMFALMAVSGIGLYLPWALINPTAFYHSAYSLFHYIPEFVYPSRYRISTGNVPFEPISPSFNLLGLLATYFPRLGKATISTIGLSELIVQLPLWVTPLVILLVFVGLSVLFKRRPRLGLVMLVWIGVPLVLMLPYFRDVRYLIVTAPAYAFLAAIAGSQSRSKGGRARLRALLVGSTLIFLMIALPVSQQMYGGIDDASKQLASMGLSDQNVLTNAPALSYYLPRIHQVVLSPGDEPSSVVGMIKSDGIKAVFILHNGRGAWPDIDPDVVQAIRNQFRGYVSGGPSAFSWYELFYDPIY
jgi:4-amino-4-deoxy-L-arabinose transferase-like glycosyltransferase